jgi:hypothetical protein
MVNAVRGVPCRGRADRFRRAHLRSRRKDVPAHARWIYASLYLHALGRFEESSAEMRHAVEQDPLNATCHGLLAAHLVGAGRLEEALSAAARPSRSSTRTRNHEPAARAPALAGAGVHDEPADDGALTLGGAVSRRGARSRCCEANSLRQAGQCSLRHRRPRRSSCPASPGRARGLAQTRAPRRVS